MKRLIIFAFGLLVAAANVQAATTTVKDGLKEAGWATVPIFLDAATSDITIKFPKEMGGGKLKFGGTIDAEELKNKTFVFTTLDDKKLKWDNAFGMSFLDLTDVAMTLKAAKGVFEITLDGKVGGPFKKSGKPSEVIIELAVEEKTITNFALSLPDTSLHLSQIPELKSIPGASKMAFASPTISLDAIGGKMEFKGETLDAVAFYDKALKSWNIGLNLEKPMTLGKLVGHNKGFLKDVVMPKMRILSSTKGLKSPYGDLPLAMRQFFSAGADLPDGDLELVSGINILTSFDPAIQPKSVKGGLATIGIVQPVEIDGTVEGVFGGTPAVDLKVAFAVPANHGFPFMKAKAGAETAFFIKLSKVEQAVGFSTSVDVKSKKETLVFGVDFDLVDREEVIEIEASGHMQGNWNNAAGIHGLTLANPFMSVGINATGAFDVLIDGTIAIGKEEVRATGDLVILPEAAFTPEAVAFAGTLNKLPFTSLMAQALKHSKVNVNGLKKVKAEFRDVAFAFMSPGAHLPEDLAERLSIEGAGMALSGQLWAHDKELGGVAGHVSTDGISFLGTLAPIHLGPLMLKDSELQIQGNTETIPSFLIKGELDLFKGFKEVFDLELGAEKMLLAMETKFGGAFDAKLTVESDGFKPGSDLAFEAILNTKYLDQFKNLTKEALKGFEKADKDIKKAESDVKSAENSIKSINSKIDSAKAKAEAARKKADSSLSGAKKKVDSLSREISDKKQKAHDLRSKAKHDAKKLKLGKAGKEEGEAIGLEAEVKALEAAKKTADWALNAAKKTADAATKASPEVIALEAELKTAQAGLKVAEGVLEAARAVNKGVAKATEAVAKAGQGFKLNGLGASGSLEGILTAGKKGDSPTLIADVTILNKHHVYRENLGSLEKGFANLAKGIAKEVAKELVKAFEGK
jgi:predicted  nucleic acid-binding Zn-ribbon protein